MKILIVGANFNNKGAQSMLFITMDELKKRFPDCEIFFGSLGENIDLSNYSLLLTILVLSGFLYSIASVIGDFLIILRKQVYLLYVYVAMALLTNILTPIAMREFGLFGAGLSFVIVMLFYTIASWIVFVIMRRKEIQKYESVE